MSIGGELKLNSGSNSEKTLKVRGDSLGFLKCSYKSKISESMKYTAFITLPVD